MLRLFMEWWCREIFSLLPLSPAAVVPGMGDDVVVEMLPLEAGQSPAVRLTQGHGASLGIAGDFTNPVHVRSPRATASSLRLAWGLGP